MPGVENPGESTVESTAPVAAAETPGAAADPATAAQEGGAGDPAPPAGQSVSKADARANLRAAVAAVTAAAKAAGQGGAPAAAATPATAVATEAAVEGEDGDDAAANGGEKPSAPAETTKPARTASERIRSLANENRTLRAELATAKATPAATTGASLTIDAIKANPRLLFEHIPDLEMEPLAKAYLEARDPSVSELAALKREQAALRESISKTEAERKAAETTAAERARVERANAGVAEILSKDATRWAVCATGIDADVAEGLGVKQPREIVLTAAQKVIAKIPRRLSSDETEEIVRKCADATEKRFRALGAKLSLPATAAPQSGAASPTPAAPATRVRPRTITSAIGGARASQPAITDPKLSPRERLKARVRASGAQAQ